MDDKVYTPLGVGTVVYVEDVYMEVDIRGNEHGFDAPFDDVTIYEDPAVVKSRKDSKEEDRAFTAMGKLPDELIAAGFITWKSSSILVRAIGGEASDWDTLTYKQKLNFIAMANGTLVEVLMTKYS